MQILAGLDYHHFYIESTVRGYHAYYKQAVVSIGEVLYCEPDYCNQFDDLAVSVFTEDGMMVGHVPVELSEIMHKFIYDHGELEVEVIGSRLNRGKGKGLEIPVDYCFIGNFDYLKSILCHLEDFDPTPVIKL
jgi:hypothetical protein